MIKIYSPPSCGFSLFGDFVKYYIYTGKVNDEVVYVGKGTKNRHLHLNSGVSSCYSANQFHFQGGTIDVEIIEYFESEKDAISREKELILSIKPSWNIVYTINDTRPPNVRRRLGQKVDGSSSVYIGVRYSKNDGQRDRKKPWRAYLKLFGKFIHVGYYETEREAAEARDSYIKSNSIELPLNF